MIAIGKIDAKTIDINSKRGNSHKLLIDNVKQIIMKSGMETIGGFVKVDIVFAIFNFEFIF
jgi:hypothetical protein